MPLPREIPREITFRKTLRGSALTFTSTWGLFSPEHIDDGTRLLLENVSVKHTDTILDLGCGYGAVGLTLARFVPRGRVHLVDKDFVAIEYAKLNARENHINNVEIHLSNGFSHITKNTRFDCIVANLSAKASKEFFWILFADARTFLNPGGTITVVTISGLKEFIKRNFIEVFGNYEKIAHSRQHVVASATKRTRRNHLKGLDFIP